jgi:hypothetical protein
MLATVAMLLALVQPSTHLEIQPWTGNDLVATAATAAKFRLVVKGKPDAAIRLQAANVARGWLAAFCLPNLCSPQHLSMRLPKSGQAVVQFELIREADDAPNQSGARITADDGAFVDVPAAAR